MMKNIVRKEMMAKRKNLEPSIKKRLDQSIIDQIKCDVDYIKSKVIAIYMPMVFEVDILDLSNEDKIFLIPKVIGDEMIFIRYQKGLIFYTSSFGVKEPMDELHPYDGHIDYMVTPGLAISKDKYRLGYGKGFYDKFLSKHRPKHVIGVIYPFQELDKLEHDDHDQKLDKYYIGVS